MIRMPVFGSSVSTGTASLPKWRRRSRERFNRSRSVSRRWKMCSFTAPDTDSGARADRAKNSDGNSYVNSSQDGSSSVGWHRSARVYALVARDRTLLSAARACGWRNRLSAAVLGCDRLGLGTSLRSGQGAGQQHYLDYFYPGALIMIVLFTSIFTMMSVIED